MSQNIATNDNKSWQGYVGIAEESSYGESTAPSTFIEVVTEGFSGDNAVQYLETIRSGARYWGVAGAFEDSGDVEFPAAPENGLGVLLKGVFGSTTNTGSDPVGTHEFTPADDLPSFSVEVGAGKINAARHVGVGVNELSFEHVGDEDFLMVTADLPASEPKLQGSSNLATPTYSDLRPFTFSDGTITLDGTDQTTDVQDLSWSITRNLDPQHRGSRTVDKMHVGRREVGGTMTLDFDDDALWKKFLGGADASGVQDTLYAYGLSPSWSTPETIESSGTNYAFDIDVPRVRLDTHNANLDGTETIAEEVEWTALVDATAGYDIKATLTNGQTAAY